MKKWNIIAILTALATACVLDPTVPANLPGAPTVSVDERSLSRASMLVTGSFGSDLTDITSYGVEMSETLFEDGKTYEALVPQQVNEDGSFSLGVTGLKANQMYFIRSFISNGHSKLYSRIFTESTPETSVASVSDVTEKDGLLSATIEDNGGRLLEEVGFVWGDTDERRSLRREKRHAATLEADGKTFTLPVSLIDISTCYVLAYVDDENDGTGFSRISFKHEKPYSPDPYAITVNHYLTFLSEGESRVSLENNTNPTLYYSLDKQNWFIWDYDELAFSADSPIYICGENRSGINEFDACSSFKTTGDACSISGNIMSLLDKEEESLAIPSEYCFQRLFVNCSNLTSGPELPATRLKEGCYKELFYNCERLNYVKCHATTGIETGTENWLSGVAESGTFVKASNSEWTIGASGIPEGWIIKEVYSPWMHLKLNEVFPSSNLAPEEAFIEFYNDSDETLSLAGITIIKDKGRDIWTGIEGEEIAPHGYFAIIGEDSTNERGLSAGISSKKGVRFDLFDPSGFRIDAFQRGNISGEALENYSGSWSRVPDGTGRWMCTITPTPNTTNSTDASEDDSLMN